MVGLLPLILNIERGPGLGGLGIDISATDHADGHDFHASGDFMIAVGTCFCHGSDSVISAVFGVDRFKRSLQYSIADGAMAARRKQILAAELAIFKNPRQQKQTD